MKNQKMMINGVEIREDRGCYCLEDINRAAHRSSRHVKEWVVLNGVSDRVVKRGFLSRTHWAAPNDVIMFSDSVGLGATVRRFFGVKTDKAYPVRSGGSTHSSSSSSEPDITSQIVTAAVVMSMVDNVASEPSRSPINYDSGSSHSSHSHDSHSSHSYDSGSSHSSHSHDSGSSHSYDSGSSSSSFDSGSSW